MIDLVQLALDYALYDKGVFSFWQRKAEVAEHDEYIVYTQSGDSEDFYADDKPLIKSADITVKYYYRAEMIDTPAGRQAVKQREREIKSAMAAAGFDCPNGAFDAGDVDGIGFFVTVFELSRTRSADED